MAIPSPTQSDRPGFFLGLPNVVQTSFPGAPQPQTGGPTPAPRTSGGTVPSGGSGGVQASSAGAPPASQAPPSGDARPEAAPQNAYQRLPVRLPPPARVDGQEMQSHARDNNPHIPAPLRTPLPPSASPRDALVRAHDPLRPSLQPQPEPQPAPTPAPTPPPSPRLLKGMLLERLVPSRAFRSAQDLQRGWGGPMQRTPKPKSDPRLRLRLT